MKVLLLGSNGQLGRALQTIQRDIVWTAVDVDEVDITQLEAVRRAVQTVRPNAVINAAAYTDVDGAEENAEAAYKSNAVGARNVALAAAEAETPVLHVSTDYVFDGLATRPYHEYDPTGPRSVYGASKLAGEEAVRSLNPRHYIVRTAWLYHTVGRNFPKTIVTLAEREDVRVVSDQFGSPTFAPHLASALLELLPTSAYGTYHMAGSGETCWYEFARVLYGLLGISTPVSPVSTACFPRPAERPRYSVLTTIQEPRILLPPWQEGVKAFVRECSAG